MNRVPSKQRPYESGFPKNKIREVHQLFFIDKDQANVGGLVATCAA